MLAIPFTQHDNKRIPKTNTEATNPSIAERIFRFQIIPISVCQQHQKRKRQQQTN